MIRIAIATLGCKTNAYDSAAIIDQFDAALYRLVPFQEDADIYIINTCTVTNRTDFKSRNLIRKALKHKDIDPSVKVIVTGCFAQRSHDEIAAMGAIDLIVDNQQKADIAALIRNSGNEFEDIMSAKDYRYAPVTHMVERSRAFQKIQDGCDFYCSYCAVPYARGHNRSASFKDVIAQAELFVRGGYKEIVLGGVNLGLYRDKDHDLCSVINAMQGIDGLELIRVSSIEPQLFDHTLLDCLASNSKVCPHFHIPLQSGSDGVLRRMGRRYDSKLFIDLIESILARIPDAAIGADVICGFPQESDAESAQTYDLISSLPLAYLHVFSYSKRSGTPAAKLSGQIPSELKSQRGKALSQLSEDLKARYTQALIDKHARLRGVVEEIRDSHATVLSDHFIRAYTLRNSAIGQVIEITASQRCMDGISD